jgi:uncharacterized membrane protein YeaQ/YmgE (transglycosylase-associated protein family)
MIGMNFPAFFSLLVLGIFTALVFQFGLRYRVLQGLEGFAAKSMAGWIGGWLGSPVLGHWGIHVANLYFIPAIVGAFAGSFCVTATLRALKAISQPAQSNLAVPQIGPVSGAKPEMRKAS